MSEQTGCGDGRFSGLSLLLAAAAAMTLQPALAASAATSAPAPAATEFAIRVAGNKLVDAAGKTIQLRGVNLSGLEFTAIQGWSPTNPWGNTNVDFPGILKWHANVVRFPLNEGSWQDRTCLDGAGKSHPTDPGHNYKATVIKSVDDATKAGLYVIIDLHLSAPANFCPFVQGPMANADNSPKFWTEVATQFKGYPNVMFELFNEPFMDWIAWGQNPWKVLRDGGNFTQFGTGTDGHWQANYDWKSVGMQQLVDTVRATGATNVVLVGSLAWSRDIRSWLDYKPKDPLNQMAAVWHAYPKSGQPGSVEVTQPGFGVEDYDRAADIVAAGIPLVITETGDHNTPGTKGAPFVSKVLPWADKNGVSYLGWTWNAWDRPDAVLLKDNSGKPSDGYGQYFQAHLACKAAGTLSCP